jgi:DNA helicase II / ATP-dependent DNA helicase PcrA
MYLRCPRQFYYEFMLGLSGKREDSAYVQFHLCVYRVLRWMHDERAAGRKPNETAALAKLAEVWQKRGPHDHLYEAMYRRSAENMVTHWAGRPMRRRSNAIQAEWAVDLPHGRITLVPDHLEQLEDGREIVERLRTGRPTKSELDKDIYGLYVAAAREAHPRVSRKVQIRYLSNDVIQPVELKEKAVRARLDRYDGAIAGILQEEFPPEPNERDCPRCPHYFICPLAEDR